MALKANYIPLPKSEREPVAGARLVAPANPDERMEVSVRLRRKAKRRPASERHISYQQLDESYGSDAADVAQVTDFAASNGLVVVEANAAKRTVKLSGTVGAFSAAFDVQLGHYEQANMTYRGRNAPIGLPKTREGIVVGVFGLDNRPFARPHFRTFNPRAGTEAQFAGLS